MEVCLWPLLLLSPHCLPLLLSLLLPSNMPHSNKHVLSFYILVNLPTPTHARRPLRSRHGNVLIDDEYTAKSYLGRAGCQQLPFTDFKTWGVPRAAIVIAVFSSLPAPSALLSHWVFISAFCYFQARDWNFSSSGTPWLWMLVCRRYHLLQALKRRLRHAPPSALQIPKHQTRQRAYGADLLPSGMLWGLISLCPGLDLWPAHPRHAARTHQPFLPPLDHAFRHGIQLPRHCQVDFSSVAVGERTWSACTVSGHWWTVLLCINRIQLFFNIECAAGRLFGTCVSVVAGALSNVVSDFLHATCTVSFPLLEISLGEPWVLLFCILAGGRHCLDFLEKCPSPLLVHSS